MLRVTLPSTIEIAAEMAATAPIFGDPGQLHQVIVNLMTNAAQAINGRVGKITLRLWTSSAGQLPPDKVIVDAAVCLSIADTGCGMDAEICDRIFDPFFTTKSIGEGTGLGLSVVHGIVKSHGGRIGVQSSRGLGTTFIVVLPVYAGEIAMQPLEAAST